MKIRNNVRSAGIFKVAATADWDIEWEMFTHIRMQIQRLTIILYDFLFAWRSSFDEFGIHLFISFQESFGFMPSNSDLPSNHSSFASSLFKHRIAIGSQSDFYIHFVWNGCCLINIFEGFAEDGDSTRSGQIISLHLRVARDENFRSWSYSKRRTSSKQLRKSTSKSK